MVHISERNTKYWNEYCCQNDMTYKKDLKSSKDMEYKSEVELEVINSCIPPPPSIIATEGDVNGCKCSNGKKEVYKCP